jgi:hypothetical protein
LNVVVLLPHGRQGRYQVGVAFDRRQTGRYQNQRLRRAQAEFGAGCVAIGGGEAPQVDAVGHQGETVRSDRARKGASAVRLVHGDMPSVLRQDGVDKTSEMAWRRLVAMMVQDADGHSSQAGRDQDIGRHSAVGRHLYQIACMYRSAAAKTNKAGPSKG